MGHYTGTRWQACLVLDAVLVDDDPRELVREVLAGAEHVVASIEGGHWDTLRDLEGGLVEAGAEGIGGGGGRVEDAAGLGLPGEAWAVVGGRAGACELKRRGVRLPICEGNLDQIVAGAKREGEVAASRTYRISKGRKFARGGDVVGAIFGTIVLHLNGVARASEVVAHTHIRRAAELEHFIGDGLAR